MIELPESKTLANQINEALKGKVIRNVTANKSPHKFAWFTGDPSNYHSLLAGKSILLASAFGGMVEIQTEDVRLIFFDGIFILTGPITATFHMEQNRRIAEMVKIKEGQAE